jgi:hypothetical protein
LASDTGHFGEMLVKEITEAFNVSAQVRGPQWGSGSGAVAVGQWQWGSDSGNGSTLSFSQS